MTTRSRELESRQSVLAARSLRTLLDETFAIYGRYLWRLIALVAVVQAPVSVVTLGLFWALGGRSAALDQVTLIATLFLSVLGTVFFYGAGVFAVGQQCVTGHIGIRECYDRVWLRVLSLMTLGVALAAALYLVLVVSYASQSLVVVASFLLLLLAILLAIYWSLTIQAVIVEGYRPVGALRRSFTLVRGSWWRVFGITLVSGLVAFGLAIIAAIPFTVLSMILEAGGATFLVSAILSLGGVVVGIVVPPVLIIVGTLLYYDLRVRKERYDLSILSQELGIATA